MRLRAVPSAVQPLPNRSLVLRDDLAGTEIGGGKLRKLEWLLAENATGDVITLGPAGGLHLLSSAVVGRKLGLRVHAVAWPQRWLPLAEAQLRAMHAHAETVWPSRSRAHALARLARVWATVRAQSGEAPAIWGPGGSDAAGTLGWVEAALELAERAASGEFVLPPRVVVAQGSGGTAAGLQVGLALAGVAVEVHTLDTTGFGARLVKARVAAVTRLLAARGLRVPPLPPLRVIAEGSPYGEPSVAGGKAALWAEREGFGVEPVYSGKALAYALQSATPFLFINSGNGLPLGPLLRSALPVLPARLAALWC